MCYSRYMNNSCLHNNDSTTKAVFSKLQRCGDHELHNRNRIPSANTENKREAKNNSLTTVCALCHGFLHTAFYDNSYPLFLPSLPLTAAFLNHSNVVPKATHTYQPKSHVST